MERWLLEKQWQKKLLVFALKPDDQAAGELQRVVLTWTDPRISRLTGFKLVEKEAEENDIAVFGLAAETPLPSNHLCCSYPTLAVKKLIPQWAQPSLYPVGVREGKKPIEWEEAVWRLWEAFLEWFSLPLDLLPPSPWGSEPVNQTKRAIFKNWRQRALEAQKKKRLY